MLDNRSKRGAGNGVTGPEIGFHNLHYVFSPKNMPAPTTAFGIMLHDSTTPPPVDPAASSGGVPAQNERVSQAKAEE